MSDERSFDPGMMLRRIRNGFRAVATERGGGPPPVALGPVGRTDAWRQATAYHYKTIKISDEGTRITFKFRNAPVLRPGSLAAFRSQLGTYLGGGLLLGSLVAFIRGSTPTGWVLLIFALIIGCGAFGAATAVRGGVFGVTARTFFFRSLYGKGKVETVDRTLFAGTFIKRDVEKNIYSGRSRDVFYVCIRFGAVQEELAVFDSAAPADQLALLINEALRQQLGAATAAHIITRNDDL